MEGMLLQVGVFLIGVAISFAIAKTLQILARPYWPSPLHAIPGPKPTSFLHGNIQEVLDRQAMEPQIGWINQNIDSPMLYYRLYFNEARVMAVEPQLVKTLLNDRTGLLSKDLSSYRGLAMFIGDGLVTQDGDKHSHHRKIINPAFKFHNIKGMTKMFGKQTLLMMEKVWANKSDGSMIDMSQDMNNLTLNIIGLSAFGFDFDSFSEDDHALGKIVSNKFSNIIGGRSMLGNLILVLFPFLLHAPIRSYRSLKVDLQYSDKLVKDLIDRKRKSLSTDNNNNTTTTNINTNAEPSDLLDLLLLSKDDDTGLGFTDDELVQHVTTFLFAGHETTATLVTWVFFALTQHPDILQRIRDELDSHLGDRIMVEYSDIAQLTYLNAVIKETLRVYPPVAIVTRKAERDIQYDKYTIPAGTTVSISPYIMHHHPRLWDNPEEFNPDRWLSETRIPAENFIPFLKGPRNCIGEKFAMMEGTVILGMLLRQYSFEMDPDKFAAVKRRLSVTMRPHPNLVLKLVKRNKSN